ncbi:MAG: hypothetical protein ACRCWM_01920 [Sarcina sp.]
MYKFDANLARIEGYVEDSAKKRIKSFYPQTVSRKLNIPIDIVIIELVELIKKGRIYLKYQIRCLEDLDTIETVHEYKEFLDKEMQCDTCGECIKVTYSNIYPVYYINEEYRDFVKKNNKNLK